MTITTTPALPDTLLNIRQASAYLSVSVSTIRRRMEEGTIRYVRLGGTLRFRRSDLDDYRDNGIVEPGAPPPPTRPITPSALSQARSRRRAA